jgi:cytidyltransferase-related domain
MGKTIIGYTSGVYDLFHIGHLNLLKNAKGMCNVLIVGVSVDELVEEYKHHRPVIPFEERIEIVRAIRYVDIVVPQTTLDKFEAWKKLRFDRLFHGDDWKGSAMYDEIERRLSEVGVETVYFPYTKVTSSSLLSDALKKIRERDSAK